MITKLLALALFAQFTVPMHTGAPASPPSGCTPPTMTYRWPVYGSGNTCNGGSACANGNGIDKLVDVVAANNATQATSGNRPIYTTGAVNSLPAASFTASNGDLTDLTSPISLSVTTMAYYAVVQPTSGAFNKAIVGGNPGAIEWRLDSTNHQELLIGSVASIGTSTSAISTSSFSTIAVTYNISTGAYVFYVCSGGTCTSDGSGTNVQTPADNVRYLGGGVGGGETFDGYIAEAGFSNTGSTSGLGAYSLCIFGR